MMGNTVGSQISLNPKQKNVLLGTLLGDGSLELNGRHVRLRTDHGIKQKEYVKWKHRIFFNLTKNKVKCFCMKADKRTNKKYRHCKFDTISTPLLDKLYKIFYDNNKKRVPKNIVKILKEPLSLAVWFMDDGYKRNDCNALRINTDAFNFDEQKLLQRCLEKNFGIKSKIHRKGEYWNIYIPNSDAIKFCRIIRPYVIPEMSYKISLTP